MTSRPYSARLLPSLIAEALANGHVVRVRADGTSMHPTIRDGESIAIAAVAAADIVCGDVVMCRHASRLLAHRVVRVTVSGAGRTFELRGDAKRASDAPIPSDAIVGRVVGVVRNRRLVAVSGRAARVRRAVRAIASRAKKYAESVYHPMPMGGAR
jgi:signal peptidase I